MKYDDNDQKIIDSLKKMPDVKDPISKNELYELISTKKSRKNTNKKSVSKRHKLIPIFSTALVVVILLILMPSFLNNEVTAPGDKNYSMINSESSENTEDSSDLSNSPKMVTEDSPEANENDYISYVLHHNDLADGGYGRFVFPDDQFQYAIPVTLVSSDDKPFDTEKLNIDFDLFDDVTFDLDIENQQVLAHLAEDFSFGGGTARAYMFMEVLSLMYTDQGIDKVIFTSDDDNAQGVDLGPIGIVSELDLHPLGKAMYKLSESAEAERDFLIPIRQDADSEIMDAIKKMKQDEEDFNVFGTIPLNIHLDIEDNDEQLIITFTDETELRESQEMVTMIEAILMTAKAFEYTNVQFKNSTIEQIGEYDLTKTIYVPKYVNPIH